MCIVGDAAVQSALQVAGLIPQGQLLLHDLNNIIAQLLL
jgi:hypothetical protein